MAITDIDLTVGHSAAIYGGGGCYETTTSNNLTGSTSMWVIDYEPAQSVPWAWPMEIAAGGSAITAPNKSQEGYMQIYDVVAVDTKECEVLVTIDGVIAEDEKKAMLELDLDKETRKKIKQGMVELVFRHIGEFKKYTKRVKIEE